MFKADNISAFAEIKLKVHIISVFSVLQNRHHIWHNIHGFSVQRKVSVGYIQGTELYYTPQRPLEFQAVPFVQWLCLCCGSFVFLILNSQEDHE